MYIIEHIGLTYWFGTEEIFNEALEVKASLDPLARLKMLRRADLVFDNNTRELVKCRYDLKEVIQHFMLRKTVDQL